MTDYTHAKGAYYLPRPTPETARAMPPAPADPVKPGLAVLILCAGAMHPWEEGKPRQLRAMGNETILARIIRQVRHNEHEPTIVTYRDDIRAAVPDCQFFEPLYRRSISETWLYTRELWREQTAILLGDVVHGKLTMKNFLAYRGSMKMLGNSAEIFAFTFSGDEHDGVAQIIYETNLHTFKGSPWEIYRHWCGAPFGQRGFREKEVFQWVWDRTCDIDTPSEYRGAVGVFKEGGFKDDG